MADVHDPSVPSSPTPGGSPAPKKAMSTGTKVAIGCGIAAVLAIVVVVIAMVAGGMFLKDKADDMVGGFEAQEEASQKVQELEREHPFTAPADGIVDPDRAETFLAVTNTAWEKMREDMEDLAERGESIEESGGEAGFGDAMAGVQTLGRSRVAIAEALDEHEMPVSEYIWLGMELTRAYQAIDMAPEQSGVPAPNLEIAREHREELAEIVQEQDGERIGKGAVLGMAWTWATSEGVSPALGWDTLAPPSME